MLSMIHSMLQTKNYKEIERVNYFNILTTYDTSLWWIKTSHRSRRNQHIKNYLEIQRIRYGESYRFALTFDERLHNALVPSLTSDIC